MTDNSNPEAGSEQPGGVIVKDNAARISSVRTSGPEGAPMSVATSKGVLATATDERMGGLGRHGLSEQHTRVKVGNLELSLGEAIEHGYVIREGGGKYRDVSAAEVQASQEAADQYEAANQDPDDFEVGLDPQGTAIVQDMAAAVEEQGYAIPSVVAEFLANPNQVPEGLARAAIARGIDVKETYETLRNVAATYASFIDSKLVEVAGIPQSMLPEFGAWLSEPGQSQKRMQAVLELLTAGSAKAFMSLGRDWMANGRAGKAAQAAADRRDPINADGVKITTDPRTGERYVRLASGVTTSEAAARRAGLI